MRAFSICLIVFMAAAVMFADKKSDTKFSPGPASSFSSKQTNDNVTVAAIAYSSEELAHTAFGKLDPNQYGVLPVLIIIQNDTDQALKLDRLEAEYTPPNGRHLEATPAGDIQTMAGAARLSLPNGSRLPQRKHKGPLNVWEIEGRSFSVKMLPPHESANGFFYFQTAPMPGAKLYLTGIKIAATGKDVFYFEIPLDTAH